MYNVNRLYQALINRIRRVATAPLLPGINPFTNKKEVIPFSVGRIYKTVYNNYKHDPRPLLFVMSSDVFYTTGINIHYLGGQQTLFMTLILEMRNSNRLYNGLIIYHLLKMRAYGIIRLGFRKYFTRFLRGKLVSDGISQIPTPGKAWFITEPFVKTLNREISRRIYMSQVDQSKFNETAKQAEYRADAQIIKKRGLTNG